MGERSNKKVSFKQGSLSDCTCECVPRLLCTHTQLPHCRVFRRGRGDRVMTVPKYIAFQWERKVGQHFRYGIFHECRLGGISREVIC